MGSAFPTKQDGIALLVFIILLSLATLSVFMSGLSPEQIDLDKQAKTRAALNEAKAALLAYAMNYPDTAAGIANPNQGPGNLPCPDRDNNGTADIANCNNNNNSPGRLPYDTLDVEPILDGDGETLWYAVSQNFAAGGATTVNTATTGRITVKDNSNNLLFDGATPNGIIAVIISPGVAIEREDDVIQLRGTDAERDDPINYMDIAFFNTADEEDNADFINSNSNNGLIDGVVLDAVDNVIVNDVIETITWQDLFDYVHARVASDMADAVRGYKNATAPPCSGTWPYALAYDSTLGDGEFGEDIVEDPEIQQGAFRVDDAKWAAGNCASNLLPAWFEAEEWHLNTFYASADVNDCVAANCLSDDGVTFDKQFVLVFTGQHGLDASAVNTFNTFLPENNDADRIFSEAATNDNVWGFTAAP